MKSIGQEYQEGVDKEFTISLQFKKKKEMK
jgi:hypothetical protein